MNTHEILEEIKRRPIAVELLKKVNHGAKTGYECICDDCTGGTGKKGTGAEPYGDRTRLGCFTCKENGRRGIFTNVDVIAYHLGLSVTGAPIIGADKLEVARFAADYFGLTLDDYTSPVNKKVAAPRDTLPSPAKQTAAAELDAKIKAKTAEIVAADIAGYLAKPTPVPSQFARAITPEMYERFHVVYDPQWTPPRSRAKGTYCTPTKRIIFICGNTYVARLADSPENYPAESRDYIHRVENSGGGEVEIFNVGVIDKATDATPVFVVEGAFDAISIMQATGLENVVAVHGTPHWNKLLKKITSRSDCGRNLIVHVMFDDDKAGRAAAEAFQRALVAKGVPAITRILPRAAGDTSDEKNDANYILQKFGADALKEALRRALDGAGAEFIAVEEEIAGRADSELKTAEKPETDSPITSEETTVANENENRADSDTLSGLTSFADYVGSGRFDLAIEHDRQYVNRKTGFSNIDGVTKFLPSLGFIGGTPGIGKSDFVIQLLDNVCSAGLYGLYLPLELPLKAVAARIFARRLYRLDGLSRLSAADIRTGGYTAKLDVVRAEVISALKNLKIDEEIPATCQQLTEKLERYCASVPTPPVVVLDYLQILDFTGEKERRVAIDKMARALKKLQMSTDATIIVVSAVNRAAYHLDADSSALKESGGLEFNADFVWLMQYAAVLAEGGASRADIRKAGRRDPREVTLSCTKNREQPMFDCYFNYHAAHSYFEACDEFSFIGGEEIAEPPEPSRTVGGGKNKNQDLD